MEEEDGNGLVVTYEDRKARRDSVQAMAHLNCIIRAFLAGASEKMRLFSLCEISHEKETITIKSEHSSSQRFICLEVSPVD